MTYTFKLARRLARIRTGALIATLFTVACAGSDSVGPETSLDPEFVDVSPDSAALDVDGEMQFEAYGAPAGETASYNYFGWWRGRIVDLDVNPDSSRMAPGTERLFSARGRTSYGSSVTAVVRWSATGGTVSSVGKYTAGKVPGTYKVIARASTGAADTAIVVVSSGSTGGEGPPEPGLDHIELSPSAASLRTGATQQFIALGKGNSGNTMPVVLSYAATGGAISKSGLFTAGQATGNFAVIATDSATRKADTAVVTLTTTPPPPPPPPSLQAVVMTPVSATLSAGGKQQFAVTGKNSDGSTKTVAVTYSATGGSVSSSGQYTAGSNPGTYRVIASEASGLADTKM